MLGLKSVYNSINIFATTVDNLGREIYSRQQSPYLILTTLQGDTKSGDIYTLQGDTEIWRYIHYMETHKSGYIYTCEIQI